jgi:hypothetical protein
MLPDFFFFSFLFLLLCFTNRTLRAQMDGPNFELLDAALTREAEAQAVCYADPEMKIRINELRADIQKKKTSKSS